MIEILYSPQYNKLFIFTGCYKFDDIKKTMILYLFTEKKSHITINSKELVHVGWL